MTASAAEFEAGVTLLSTSERLFPTDRLTKRERVERTLNLEPVAERKVRVRAKVLDSNGLAAWTQPVMVTPAR